MNGNENEHIFTTLILRGEGLNPEEVTNSLGLNPSMSFKRGDRRNETDIWKHNYWSLSSQDRIHSSNLAIHLEWLINQFEPEKSKFLEILNNKNTEGEISCFWILPTDHENLSLSPDLIKKIAELGLSLNMDIYCP
jgi:hypothetical protein